MTYFSFLTAATILASSLSYGAAPTSAIPERREFPINPAINPCTDFYQYACSKALSGFKLRDDRSYHAFAFDDSSERLLKAKEQFLTGLYKDKKPKTVRSQELSDVFQACMSEKSAIDDERGIVNKLLTEVNNLKTPGDFSKFLGKKFLSQDFSAISFGTIENFDTPENYDLYLIASLKTLPERSYYQNKALMKDFEDLLTMFFESIGRDEPRNRAKAVIKFEKAFAQSYPLPAELRDIVSTRTSITKAELISRFPALNLKPLLDEVPDSTLIRNLTDKNFEWLNTALTETSVVTLQDVYLWHGLRDVVDDAYPKLTAKRLAFNHKHLGGPVSRPPRSERCTELVMDNFTKELDAELVDKIFPNFPTEKFVALAEKVRKAIITGLENNRWLSDSAREEAINKMRTATLQLVKPRNDVEWDFNPPADYSPLKPRTNIRMLSLNLRKKELKDLKKPRRKEIWYMGPLTVNAYYSPSDNKFVMPIGILQYPFYDPNAPEEVNLGAIGAVIGHELGHGVDDKGSRYDSKGKLRSWMTDKDLAEFNKRSSKLVSQFNAIGHNGTLTLGENIGDLVGLTFAYKAAFPDGKGNSKQKQAFFLQYARSWCYTARPKARERRLKTDPHSLGEARVNEQMKHQAGFAEVFQCKKGDKMYLPPKERVTIW